MAERQQRKSKPTRELFKELLSKFDRVETRLASVEQQLVLNQNELARHGRMIEEANTRYIETLGLKCAELAKDEEDEEEEVTDERADRNRSG